MNPLAPVYSFLDNLEGAYATPVQIPLKGNGALKYLQIYDSHLWVPNSPEKVRSFHKQNCLFPCVRLGILWFCRWETTRKSRASTRLILPRDRRGIYWAEGKPTMKKMITWVLKKVLISKSWSSHGTTSTIQGSLPCLQCLFHRKSKVPASPVRNFSGSKVGPQDMATRKWCRQQWLEYRGASTTWGTPLLFLACVGHPGLPVYMGRQACSMGKFPFHLGRRHAVCHCITRPLIQIVNV